MEIKANICLIEIADEVFLDDFDKSQNEYECLFDDFEKLRHRCKDYKKIIATLTFDVKNAKLEYDVVIDNKNELEKYIDVMKSENKILKLELEEKCKALNNYLNENVALKVFINEKEKHTNHMHANRHSKKKQAHISCYECGRKCHITFYYSYKAKHSSFKKIWVPKDSHVLTNNEGPIKVWVPRSST